LATITGRITLDERDIIEATSDPATGAGTPASVGSFALITDGTAWLKTGAADTAWTQISNTPKAGSITPASFTGSPKTAAVAFVTPFSSANYAVLINSIDSRIWTISNVTASGFTVSANATQALTANVFWEAIFGDSNV